MTIFHSDVVVHIDETLDEHRILDLERQVGTQEGVFSACVNDKARHLMVVEYDPTRFHSREILSGVRRNGLHAELIGL
jgi:hypothetical protein